MVLVDLDTALFLTVRAVLVHYLQPLCYTYTNAHAQIGGGHEVSKSGKIARDRLSL